MSPPERDAVVPTTPALPRAVSEVEEVAASGEDHGRVEHPEWRERFPWLVHGTTTASPPRNSGGTGVGREGDPGVEADSGADFGVVGSGPSGDRLARWTALAGALGTRAVVHARQVHGAVVRLHEGVPEGIHLAPACDGHVTRQTGLLVTVATADCVPVSIVDPARRVIALLHAGWRGVAAGILPRAVEVLADRLACDPDGAHLHLGPAICGRCYEVGPEVHAALGLEEPEGARPVDLRARLAERAIELGFDAARVTVSSLCTRCGEVPFFSHRAGDTGRQVGYLGIRPA